MRQIALLFKRLYISISAYLFVHGVGPLPQRFEQLVSAQEKAIFAQSYFGKEWLTVLNEYMEMRRAV